MASKKAETTTARVYSPTLDRLHELKEGRESVADVVQRLCERAEAEDDAAAGQDDDSELGRMEERAR